MHPCAWTPSYRCVLDARQQAKQSAWRRAAQLRQIIAGSNVLNFASARKRWPRCGAVVASNSIGGVRTIENGYLYLTFAHRDASSCVAARRVEIVAIRFLS